MLPYYYGPLDNAIRLAREARTLLKNRPTVTGAFAAAAEARARARAGDHGGAEQAMRLAKDSFAQVGPSNGEDDAWAFPERRLLLYLSGTLTYLGRTRQAGEVQRQALALYSQRNVIDPALLRVEGAICLIQQRNLAEACELAGSVYLKVPPAHRTDILGARTRDVIDAVPERMRTARPARELEQILASGGLPG
jgi:hypothetical protein